MPVELQAHQYLFLPELPLNVPSPDYRKKLRTQLDSGNFWDLVAEHARPLPELPEYAIDDIPVRYNPRHDLEALWWVSLSFAFLRVISGSAVAEDPAEPERLRRQKQTARALLRQSDKRYDAMTRGGRFAGHLKSLHHTVCEATWPLELARQFITDSYEEFEKDYTEEREFDVPKHLYDLLCKAWRAISDRFRLLNIEFVPLDIDD